MRNRDHRTACGARVRSDLDFRASPSFHGDKFSVAMT